MVRNVKLPDFDWHGNPIQNQLLRLLTSAEARNVRSVVRLNGLRLKNIHQSAAKKLEPEIKYAGSMSNPTLGNNILR